jgi:acyl carrier protein
MVPSIFIELSALPTTPGGKVDRRALTAYETLGIECQRSFAAARTPVEEILSALWIEILGTEQVSIHDSFLELGGHSLSAAQIISKVRDIFGVELSFRSFLDAATVASLAEQIEQASPRDSLRI